MHMLSGAVLYFMINNQSSRRDVVHVVEAPFVTAWKRQWSDHQDDLFKWKALGPCSCRIAELFVQGYTYAVLADNDCQCFTDPFGPEAERCHRDPGPNRHFHFLTADTSRDSQASSHTMLSLHLGRVGTRRALSVRLALSHPSTSGRYPPFPTYAFAQGARLFVSSPATRAPTSSSPTPTTTPRSILSRFLPSSFTSSADGSIPTTTSFRKIVALARPERRPLLTAIGLLLVSSSVSLSIPFTVGKLIDYFTSTTPVGQSPDALSNTSSFLTTHRRSRMASR